MAMHKVDLLLHDVLNHIFQGLHESSTRWRSIKALAVLALSISVLLETYLQFTVWVRTLWRALLSGNVDEDAVTAWIVQKALAVLQGYILAKVMQLTRWAVAWVYAGARRR